MNERIQELFEQVADNFDPEDCMVSEEFLKAFAELIVQECIDCLNPLSRNHSMVGAAQDTIKEHFGVER